MNNELSINPMQEKELKDCGFLESSTWKYKGRTFTVEVKGWNIGKNKYSGKQEFMDWNIYVYIYPTNPRFKDCEPNMGGCPFDLPGASFYKKHLQDPSAFIKCDADENGVTSHQYGNDYNHLWHEGKTGEEKGLDAFNDAVKLSKDIKEIEQDFASATLTGESNKVKKIRSER